MLIFSDFTSSRVGDSLLRPNSTSVDGGNEEFPHISSCAGGFPMLVWSQWGVFFRRPVQPTAKFKRSLSENRTNRGTPKLLVNQLR